MTNKRPIAFDATPDTLRRSLVLSAAAASGLGLLPGAMRDARAQSFPPLGNFPAGTEGNSVFVGVSVPLTGAFSAEGKDQQLGFELAFEHLNSGKLAGKIPELKGKGVLGKTITFGVVDTEAKAESAIQGQTRFLRNNKAILMTGCYSSAVTVALGKLAQREKVLYMAGPAGSDDVTGKDCQRYSFRSQPSTTMASRALAPVLAERLGKGKKVAYLVPDYTFGHTQFESMARLTEPMGWKTVSKQVCPIGTADFSTYLLNIANSGADVFVNCTVGNDCSVSIKQAKNFGVMKNAALVVPTLQPFLAQQLGPEVTQDILGVMDFWWSLAESNELAKQFVDDFQAKHNYKPYWPAHIAYSQMLIWAVAVERAKTFYPPEVIKALEARVPIRTTLGDVMYRPEDHQLVRPVPVMRGKKPSEMKSKDDYYEVIKMIPGADAVTPLDQGTCKMGELT
ncbi:substrate-binding protein [Methylibium petroleiphilum]|uniref:Putative urea/short-chain amide transport system substrate-binding protein n=1 Tax=Methylibium petroleiphilum (strain ATCC BAA-1232 / LMG 22953 / PM1) TaxID=420662 RepID=A2SM37_METPP|nr:substrate-binding protein [Methylibium petroleiphilum]ABM96626.1 putative urea/short-chain amide transport system substrate-binding protein [Methylibium petroleiphilum PM1]